MKGEMKVAPAFAAIIACTGEKHSVTLTITPSLRNSLQAARPSQVNGTLIVMFLAILVKIFASASMPLVSVASTSALIGPGTVAQISASDSL